LFPLDSNGLIVLSSSAEPDSIVLRVAGTQTVAIGANGTVIRRQDMSTGAETDRAYVASSGGIHQYVTTSPNAIERAFNDTDLMRLPAHAGDSFVQLDTTVDSGQDFDGDGRPDRVALHAVMNIIGLESITTSAGTLTNTLHQQQVLTETVQPSSGVATFQIVVTTDTWYAPGVGVVRNVTTQQGPGLSGTTTETLTRYRVGTLQGGANVPSVQAVSPSGVVAASAVVNAVFNEDMDGSSFASDTFTLLDSANHAIQGTVTVQGKTVSFTPAQALPTGAYTAAINATAQDLFGVPLTAARSWAFYIDNTAPGVLSTGPAANAINVSLGATIGITFSETPASSSVTTSNVRLSTGGTPVPVTLQVTGTTIAIQPVGGLLNSTHYTVDVSGVVDGVGNPMSQAYEFSFDTTPGRFASPQWLYPNNGIPYAYAVATGDVNGDGIPDVVYTNMSSSNRSYPMGVYVRTGRPDGGLNDPVQVDTTPMNANPAGGYCPLTTVAVGDVTGDGRADIVVGSNLCGILVLQQDASGALQPGQLIRTPVHSLRIADMNGDGRLDLVGLDPNLPLAYIWRQSGGQLVLNQSPNIGDVVGRDLAVGDVDGDGRPDLIVALDNPGPGNDVAILGQQPDGSFAALRYLNTGSPWGATGIAVGDLNGDGRLDIVATTGGNSPTWFAVFYQAADGGFPAVTQVSTADGPFAVCVADINGDGRADIVVTHNGWNLVGIYLQQAAGTLAPEELYAAQDTGVNMQILSVMDLNRDGLQDIVVANSILYQVPLKAGATRGPAVRANVSKIRSATTRAAP